MIKINLDNIDENNSDFKFNKTGENSGELIIKINPFKQKLVKIFNNMNHIEGGYVRFITKDQEMVFEIGILTVLCTTIVLVSYKDKVRMFNKDDRYFNYDDMFYKIEKWSKVSLEDGYILSSSVEKIYF